MNSDLKLKHRGTSGHNGSSRGSSKRKRKGKPVTVSALKQESEASKRQRVQEGKARQRARVLALRPTNAVGNGRLRRAQKAPKKKPRVHKDPGAAPPKADRAHNRP